ncbi:DUF3489 domain-containing protein [Falsiroseomonas sp. E2-1-a4]|uniref:DUF3489 domain-containing protein n=1 Tax=Falsiroseomonas sp. E2-1-a4 TaxID=3239299 RepID=UPI003F3A4A55
MAAPYEPSPTGCSASHASCSKSAPPMTRSTSLLMPQKQLDHWWGVPRVARKPGARRKPREGTKQEQVLAMLRRPEGATITQIAEAAGWAPHTGRGFFTALRKRQGFEVQVLERIRQVGPNKECARGS